MIDQQALDRLCALCGIHAEYQDVWGNSHTAPLETKQALLAAMGITVDSEEALRQALEEREARPWRRLLPPVQVVWQSEQVSVPLSVPAEHSAREWEWTVRLEGGERHSGRFRSSELEVLEERRIGEGTFVRYAFVLPLTLDSGYHQFELAPADLPSERATMRLIVAPNRCYQPAALEGEGRLWGLALQLYAMRSQRNWGIGDFGDLKAVLEVSAELGAHIVGLNPLHALFPHNPLHISPYSPSSRLFFNSLYLDIEAIPDFAECTAARELVNDPLFQAQLRALRASELVDYQAVANAKFQVL
jgi:(1->4)-alpha-D-glucan 1-alpha-D-glucosylmutase